MKNFKLKMLTCFLIILSTGKAYSHDEPIDWTIVKTDSIFIKKIIDTYRKDPSAIFKLIQKSRRVEDLGGGYKISTGQLGGNYSALFYTIVYTNDKKISYELQPQLPYDDRLNSRYVNLYKKLTRLDRLGRFIPVYYGMENFDKGFDFSKHPDKVCNKMIYLTSPFSGIVYGGRGGYAGTKLKNRAAFEAVKNILTPHDLLVLMQSINPATRLSAVELYYQKPQFFAKQKTAIENRITAIFKTESEARTINGCLATFSNARKLVEYYVKNPVK